MTASVRQFHLGDIVTVYHGVACNDDGLTGVGNLLRYMVRRELVVERFRHATALCRPALSEQFPWLDDIAVPDADLTGPGLLAWRDQLVARYGEYHPVDRLPEDTYTPEDQ